MKKFFGALLLTLFVPLAIFAAPHDDGGWISFGGELFKDAHNPWFVKNTKTVRYCISVDSATNSIGEDVVDGALKEAIKYWKGEFSRAANRGLVGHFEVGQQDFVRVACGEKPEVRIIFGSTLLSKEEKEFLVEPVKFVGVSVRQTYDRKELRGTGFVFISGDGELAKKENFVANVWSRPKILKYALMHEMGHVFGLSHSGTGLMSEIFLDQITRPQFIEAYESAPIESTVAPDPVFVNCEFGIVTTATRTFFGFPAGYDCIDLRRDPLNMSMLVFARKKVDSQEAVELGKILLETPGISEFKGKPLSFLQLTDEQTVFSSQETGFRPFLIGPIGGDFSVKGKFVPKSGAPKPVFAETTPTSLLILGNQLNGSIAPVIQYSSPLGLLFLRSPTP